MQGKWVNNLPVTLVSDGPLVYYCENCGTLYVNTSLIPKDKPKDLSYLFQDKPRVEIFNPNKFTPEIKMPKFNLPENRYSPIDFNSNSHSRSQEDTSDPIQSHFERQERIRRRAAGFED